MSTLPISSAASVKALTQLKVLSSMSTAQTAAASGKTISAAKTLFGDAAYNLDVNTLTASSDTSGFGSGSLSTGMIALSNLQTLLTGLTSTATSAADANTTAANRASLQSQYNSMLHQADSVIQTISANGITLKSLSSGAATGAVATDTVGLGLSKASWTQASDAATSESSAATALANITTVLKSFGNTATAGYAVRSSLVSAELASLSGDNSADLTKEIASLNSLSGSQTRQSIQTYLAQRKSSLITSA